MLKAISNTSPLLYLYRIGAIDWLPKLFDEVWTPEAVCNELRTGRSKGYDVPNPDEYAWLDDMLARRTAQVAGLQVWGTLKVLLETKSQGVVNEIEPYVTKLSEAGMWVSSEVRQRMLPLASES